MVRTFFLSVAVMVLASGCGKKEAAPPPPAPAPAPGQSVSALVGGPTAPVDSTPAPAPAPANAPDSAAPAPAADGGTIDPTLKSAIHRYFAEQGSAPHSWDELVRGKYLKSPPLGPDGKPLDFDKFVYSMVNSK